MSPKNPFKPNSKAYKFFEIANVDEDGFSDIVPRTVLADNGLKTINGGDWCRTDGTLGLIFNIERKIEKGKIASVRLCGYKKNTFERRVDKIMREHYRKMPCVILSVLSGHVEVDHKDGRYDRYGRLSENPLDYQPLHKCANDAKRTHCKRCKETGLRFNACLLGYSVSQYKGGEKYSGSCIGCYWYDPIEFNKNVSVSYTATR
jgi:hypothetical protein